MLKHDHECQKHKASAVTLQQRKCRKRLATATVHNPEYNNTVRELETKRWFIEKDQVEERNTSCKSNKSGQGRNGSQEHEERRENDRENSVKNSELIGSPVVLSSFRIGRLPTATICAVGFTVFSIVTAFSPTIVTFSGFRLFIGFTSTGIIIATDLIGTELVGPSKRLLANFVRNFSFAFGYLFLALLAYFIRYWWVLQLIMSLLSVPLLTLWWTASESPRWLLSSGKVKKAEKIIRKMQKANGALVPESVFEEIKANPEKAQKEEETAVGKGNSLDIFRYPYMRKRTMNLFLGWFTVSLVYYGLSLNTSNIGGNDYLNAAISAALEIPAYFAGWIIPDTMVGRRWSMCGTFVTGGIALIISLFTPSCEMVWIGITLAMIGKFFISIAYSINFVYTAELYPTPLRNKE
ncbi:solute carrier family 22 member 21-like [Ptychodera flava]|uniref:solute carrier family 22 member 21-like n=1 Tax=Ptychodera flava TaxID=63121 RepID=UPI00396A5F5D